MLLHTIGHFVPFGLGCSPVFLILLYDYHSLPTNQLQWQMLIAHHWDTWNNWTAYMILMYLFVFNRTF